MYGCSLDEIQAAGCELSHYTGHSGQDRFEVATHYYVSYLALRRRNDDT